MEATEILNSLPSLGAAGIMGTMWLWERNSARTREQQISEAHQRLLDDRIALGQIIEVVKQNSEALTRLSERLAKSP